MPEVTALHMAYRTRMDRLRDRTTAKVLASPSPSEAVQLVLAAQTVTVNDTDAYMSLEAGLATGTDTEPWGIDPDQVIGREARNGAWLEDVYGRNWAATAGTFTSRLTREVNTDMTLAARRTAWMHTEGDPRVTSWRRVLGPTKNCALCVAASTRTYRSADLQPIHSHCACSVLPIAGDAQAPTVNKPFLDQLYEEGGGTDYQSLRRVQVDNSQLPADVDPANIPAVVEVVDTAELGPTLAFA